MPLRDLCWLILWYNNNKDMMANYDVLTGIAIIGLSWL